MHIRIIATPPGEAPKPIRDQWVGVILEVDGPGPRRARTMGVVSMNKPPTVWQLLWEAVGGGKKDNVYAVDAPSAIEALRHHAPDAAAWWQDNTPLLLLPGSHLGFPVEVCEEASESELPS